MFPSSSAHPDYCGRSRITPVEVNGHKANSDPELENITTLCLTEQTWQWFELNVHMIAMLICLSTFVSIQAKNGSSISGVLF